jgi:hypothetical protein
MTRQLVWRRSCRVTVFCIDFVCPAEASTSEPSHPQSATVGSARFETILKTVPFRSLDRTSISKINYLILRQNCVTKSFSWEQICFTNRLGNKLNWTSCHFAHICYNLKLYEVELSAFKLRRRFGSVFKTFVLEKNSLIIILTLKVLFLKMKNYYLKT